MRVWFALAVVGVLANCLAPGCAGVSQEEYDMVSTDLANAKAKIAELQTQLGIERAKAKETQGQLEASEAQVVELERQLWMYQAQVAELERQLEVLEAQIPVYELPAKRTIADCVEPRSVVVRNQAVSVVANAPPDINPNSQAWKIWQINRWVANNISYIDDPKGREYFAYAHETLEVQAGDCEDLAILLASMFESVRLDAAVADIDANDDGVPDHITCLVYWPGNADSFLNEEQMIMDKLELHSPTGKLHILYFEVTSSMLEKYDSGIWITADPPMAEIKDMIGYVTCQSYEIIRTIDVGD